MEGHRSGVLALLAECNEAALRHPLLRRVVVSNVACCCIEIRRSELRTVFKE